MNQIENKKNELNFEIRSVLTIMDEIDGMSREYENYIESSMTDEEYLNKQIELIKEIKERLIGLFKE